MTDESTGESGDFGDFGEEARRLADAVQRWARKTLPAPPSGHSGPECQWCPVCQLASVLRGEHPELTERIAEAGNVLSGAFKALVEAAAAHAPTNAATQPTARYDTDARSDSDVATDTDAADHSQRVQRIRLTDPADGDRAHDPSSEEA